MTQDSHPHPPAAPAARVSLVESLVAGVLFLALLVLRVLAVRRQGWSSDETQHLHVVWAWANGLLPYRDVFDNHTPLFHLLYAPLFRALGERADIVFAMRFAIIPVFALCLWCVYRIGAALFSPRVGLWAALFTGASPSIYSAPSFFSVGGQFRTDVLWTALWLVALAIVVGGPLTRRRIFFLGLTFGAAFSVSMKTTLFVVTMFAAFAALQFWRGRLAAFDRQMALPAREWPRLAGAFFVGLVIIPGALLVFFATQGALGSMYYCIVTHNILPGTGSPGHLLKRLFFSQSTLTLIPAFLAAWTALPLFATEPGRAARRMYFLLVAGLFYHVLRGLWPEITAQDYVPHYPLLAIVAAAFAAWFGGVLSRRGAPESTVWAMPCAVALAGLGLVGRSVLRHDHESREPLALIEDVLRLTHPGETVMDAKGETIFRPRPYYYVIETFTRERLKRGLLEDDIAERMIEKKTAVVNETRTMSEKTHAFIAQNYLSVGRVQVLGQWLAPDATGFDLAIPARYTLVRDGGAAAAMIDGTPFDGPRELAAGHHEFHTDAGRMALVWARAIEAGYQPVAPSEDNAER